MRYSRQELFAPIGPEGQARIRGARVLLVGCGALGTHLAELCVRAGVSELVIIDRDFVDVTNLQRQGLFTEHHAATAAPKATAAADILRAFNSDVAITPVVADFDFRNAEALATGATLILDATDNFDTRFLINDVAVKLGIPWVYAACVGARAVCMPVLPGRGACLRCVLEDLPEGGGETCDTTGIIMPAVLQAVAWAGVVALKILSGSTDSLFMKMLSVDMWNGERGAIETGVPRPGCPTCARREFPHLQGEHGTRQTVLCGRDSVQVAPGRGFDFAAARERLGRAGHVRIENEHLLRAEFAGLEVTLFRDGRAIVHGTQDVGRARSIYARVVGS
jgi:molybdopterin/thiamine biosynthesis adenylyltransferase